MWKTKKTEKASPPVFNVILGGAVTLYHKQVEQAPPPALPSTIITSTIAGVTSTARTETMAYKLAVGKRVHVKITYVDAQNNEAAIDGEVAWGSSSDTIAAVVVDPSDSQLATITALAVGTAQINATADADLGAGVRTLVTPFDVECVSGEAVAGTISPVGEPEDAPMVNPLT